MPHRTILMKVRDLIEAIPDTAAISLSSKVTLGSGGMGIFASVAQWNWTAIIASTVAITGLAVNYYFLLRRDRREQKEFEIRLAREQLESNARIAALQDRCEL